MSGRKCPICGRPAEADHRPFCSRRCADVDLQRWFSGKYAVPAAPDVAEAAAPYLSVLTDRFGRRLALVADAARLRGDNDIKAR